MIHVRSSSACQPNSVSHVFSKQSMYLSTNNGAPLYATSLTQQRNEGRFHYWSVLTQTKKQHQERRTDKPSASCSGTPRYIRSPRRWLPHGAIAAELRQRDLHPLPIPNGMSYLKSCQTNATEAGRFADERTCYYY